MKILIAEDNPLTRQILADRMEKLGHEVRVTENGAEAWEWVQIERPQIILTDWDMPEMNGIDLSRKIRESDFPGYIYILMLSSTFTTKDHFYEAMEAGIDDFLNIPYQPRELMVRLRVAERIVRYTQEIRQLQRLLPICMYCKKIRDDGDFWQEIEGYFRQHMETTFSHGICPECYDSQVGPELQRLKEEKRLRDQKKLGSQPE